MPMVVLFRPTKALKVLNILTVVAEVISLIHLLLTFEVRFLVGTTSMGRRNYGYELRNLDQTPAPPAFVRTEWHRLARTYLLMLRDDDYGEPYNHQRYGCAWTARNATARLLSRSSTKTQGYLVSGSTPSACYGLSRYQQRWNRCFRTRSFDFKVGQP